MLSLAINPKLVGVGIFKVTSFSPLYIFPFAVIPEIVIAFAVMLTGALELFNIGNM